MFLSLSLTFNHLACNFFQSIENSRFINHYVAVISISTPDQEITNSKIKNKKSYKNLSLNEFVDNPGQNRGTRATNARSNVNGHSQPCSLGVEISSGLGCQFPFLPSFDGDSRVGRNGRTRTRLQIILGLKKNGRRKVHRSFFYRTFKQSCMSEFSTGDQ